MSTSSSGARLLAAAGILSVAAAAALAWSGGGGDGVAFARATGGLGLGAATSPAWSFHGIDPRLAPACEAELAPLPGGACPDPGHGLSLFFLPTRE